MYLEELLEECLDKGFPSDKVYLSFYSCGQVHQIPLNVSRLRFDSKKLIIDAEDN